MTTEVVRRDSIEAGPLLPEPLSSHCLLQLDPETTFLAGGKGLEGLDRRSAYLYHWDTQEWERLQDIAEWRHDHICGSYHLNDSGEIEVCLNQKNNDASHCLAKT